MQRSSRFRVGLLLGTILLGGLSTEAATWNTNANGANWGTNGNWTTPATAPNAVNAEAIFGNVITANRTVNINNDFTVGRINFNDNNSYFVEPSVAQTLTFSTFSGNPRGTGNALIDITNAGGLHSLGNNNLTVSLSTNLDIDNASPAFTLQGVITGTGDINKYGTGQVTLYGPTPSTVSGNINVNSGTLQIGITADGNQEFNNIGSININGGSLTMIGNQEFNASANVNLNGGALVMGPNNTQTFNNLTLSNNSSISLSSGGGVGAILTFTGTGTRTAGTLNIGDWSGSMGGGGPDQVIFGTSLSSTFLSNVVWVSQGITGARQLASGEIVPIPEPGSILGGIGLAALAVAYEIRRRKQNTALPIIES